MTVVLNKIYISQGDPSLHKLIFKVDKDGFFLYARGEDESKVYVSVEGGREEGREGGREGGREKEEREGGREEKGREGGREKERGGEGGREGGREGEREREKEKIEGEGKLGT